MSSLGTAERPLRVAIVGSGPSGFYAADPLLKSETVVEVDMYDRLPTPFGLVRGGVAPDHPKIRSVTRVYEKTADHERFRFLGNVMIGRDLSIEELQAHYDAVLFACGAETDRRMGIPGEDLEGSYTATSFVGWYNGHPDYRDLTFDLSQEVAYVIGVGNVAMDVARILAKTVDELKTTDIAQHALDVLAESKVKEIHLVGRRGPAQVKFTLPEIKEMGDLEDCDPVIDPQALLIDELSKPEATEGAMVRIQQVLNEYALRTISASKSKRMHFEFLLSPKELKGTDRVERIVLEQNALSGEPGRVKARGTGEVTERPCGLLFRSIGYRGIAIPGVPFHDSWGVFPNEEGRITGEDEKPVSGLYCAGWIKRGPSGIIGTNKPDAVETVKHLLADAPSLTPCPTPSTEPLLKLLDERKVRVVSLGDWRAIDKVEQDQGQAIGKPRERLTRIDEMLEVLG